LVWFGLVLVLTYEENINFVLKASEWRRQEVGGSFPVIQVLVLTSTKYWKLPTTCLVHYSTVQYSTVQYSSSTVVVQGK
jgi:hypothetical protein